MVMTSAHVESYAFQLGTDLAEVHFGQISAKLKCVENRARKTFCESLPRAAFGKCEPQFLKPSSKFLKYDYRSSIFVIDHLELE